MAGHAQAVRRPFSEVLNAPKTPAAKPQTTTTTATTTTMEAPKVETVKASPTKTKDEPERPLAESMTEMPPLAASFAPAPGLAPAPIETPVLSAARASLESLMPAMVKRIAWSGDGRKGAVRLELGAGSLAGAVLVLQADAGRVRVHMTTPPGTSNDEWRQRIEARLKASGVDVEDIHVE
jgi:hypothetical protein